MKLKIHKTSQWSFDENDPPHKNAFISKDAWYIKIGSLKALEDFSKENGSCVLGYEDGEMKIEIYDTYRE